MKTRADLFRLKSDIYWKMRNNWNHERNRDDYAEYESEIQHFENWISSDIGMVGPNCAEIHDVAVELGITDNMKLAARLYEIERRLDDITNPYPNPDND